MAASSIDFYRVPFSSIVQDEEIKLFEEELARATGKPEDLLLAIDFAKTYHISSRALGLLVALRKRLLAKGGRIVLFAANPAIQRVMEVTRLNTLIPVAASEEEAADLLRQGGAWARNEH